MKCTLFPWFFSMLSNRTCHLVSAWPKFILRSLGGYMIFKCWIFWFFLPDSTVLLQCVSMFSASSTSSVTSAACPPPLASPVLDVQTSLQSLRLSASPLDAHIRSIKQYELPSLINTERNIKVDPCADKTVWPSHIFVSRVREIHPKLFGDCSNWRSSSSPICCWSKWCWRDQAALHAIDA